MADGSYSHKYNFKWPTPYSRGTDNNFRHVSGYGYFIQYENYNHHSPSIYSDPRSGCFTYLILFKAWSRARKHQSKRLLQRRSLGQRRRVSLVSSFGFFINVERRAVSKWLVDSLWGSICISQLLPQQGCITNIPELRVLQHQSFILAHVSVDLGGS